MPVENFRNISRQTDAAMGNRMPPNFPYMQAQPRGGKTLPIRHGRAVKTTSLRYGIRGFGIVVDAFAFVHLTRPLYGLDETACAANCPIGLSLIHISAQFDQSRRETYVQHALREGIDRMITLGARMDDWAMGENP